MHTSFDLKRLVTLTIGLLITQSGVAAEKLKVLLIDGQNNHAWQTTTPVIKWALEQSGRFTVDLSTTPDAGPKSPRLPKDPAEKPAYDQALAKYRVEKEQHDAKKQERWKAWNPDFSRYSAVVSNYNGELWPEPIRDAFVAYVKNGGGFVSVHAADNAFPEWLEYNQMIGVGGWGGRNEKSGPMLRYRDGQIIRDETPGNGGTHGSQHEFVVEARQPDHPILRGLSSKWKHAGDELYAKLRGPAKSLTVLATTFSDPATNGTGEHEPMLMVTEFGKGRVFHTTLGHSAASMAGLGFQLTLARGCEWVATGTVTQADPVAAQLSPESVAIRTPTTP
jgi:type 1 glutamine amidotransferase